MSSNTLALITGANKGIGFETARQLGQQGIHVIIGARDTARGEEAVQKLAALSVQATFVQLDVTDEKSLSRAAHSLAETFGRLDILINNAGISGGNANAPSDIALEVMRTVYNTNVFGVVAVTKAMLPLLRKSQAGRIVNVSSGLGSITQASDRNDEFFQVNNLPLCWLLVVSGGQDWPVRTPLTVSCSLLIPERKSTISRIHSLIFTKGERTLCKGFSPASRG
jgi:NAD(P)-dependent dehydrogenase (short-subunit alcohol dehydrogenase family)